MVTDFIKEKYNLSEMQLYELANANTLRILKPVVKPLVEKLLSFTESLEDEDVQFLERNGLLDECPIWFIGSKVGDYGAACIMYEDMLYKLASQLESNLYILPSSIHECLLVPEGSLTMGKSELENMVREINDSEVLPEERLSDHVYFYDREQRKISW